MFYKVGGLIDDSILIIRRKIPSLFVPGPTTSIIHHYDPKVSSNGVWYR